MQYSVRKPDAREIDGAVFQSLEPVIRGMGMSLIELSVFRQKAKGKKSGAPGVQVRAVVYKDGVTGIEDCSRVHRSIMPRLELAFADHEIYLEVSSPGIDRLIKDGSEFAHYIGREVRCYRTDISDWTAGVLRSADDTQIVLQGENEEMILPFELIAKARLCAPARGPSGKGG